MAEETSSSFGSRGRRGTRRRPVLSRVTVSGTSWVTCGTRSSVSSSGSRTFPFTGSLTLALKTAESAFIGLGWRSMPRGVPAGSAFVQDGVGGIAGGTAINTGAGASETVAMIGIFRTSIPGSSVAGLAAACGRQALFFTAVSVMMLIGVAVLLPRVVSKGSPADETGGFLASHPVLIPAVVVAAS